MSGRKRLARQSASEKKWLNRKEADLINDARSLPGDHSSSDTEDPVWSIPRQTAPVLEVIRASGLVAEFENRLRDHPGQKSRLSIEALLLGVVLAAGLKQSYRRADICAVLNGLDAKVGHNLGLWNPEDTRPISYNMVRKQLKRLENSLGEGWTGRDGTPRDLAWYCHTFLAATIPHQYRHMIEAVSLDSTVSPTWAVTRDYRKEKDAVAEYQLKSLEDPDLPEPELPTPTTTGPGRAGKMGPDGRIQRSKDPDARPTYKSATSTEPARIVVGYDVHVASAVRSVTWTGDLNKVASGPAPPSFITGICVAPGATNPGPIGASIVEQSQLIATNLGDAVVDRGYSTKREKFCRRLHKQSINVTMDYTKSDLNHPTPIKSGRKGQRFLSSCGALYPPWLPEERQIPPEDADAGWYKERALWRWIPNQNLRNGDKQFICPQCAGKVSTTAETRKPQTTHTDGPHLPIEDDYCCLAFPTVTVDQLDTFQPIPFGTPAWKQSYGRRNSIETRNSILKDKGGLKAGWCRAFGLAAQTIGALALAVVHNMKELKRTLARQQRNGTVTEPSLNGTNPAIPPEEEPSGTHSNRDPP